MLLKKPPPPPPPPPLPFQLPVDGGAELRRVDEDVEDVEGVEDVEDVDVELVLVLDDGARLRRPENMRLKKLIYLFVRLCKKKSGFPVFWCWSSSKLLFLARPVNQ